MGWMRNARVGTRFAVVFASVGVLLVVVVTVGLRALDEYGQAQDVLLGDRAELASVTELKFLTAEIEARQAGYGFEALADTSGSLDDAGEVEPSSSRPSTTSAPDWMT